MPEPVNRGEIEMLDDYWDNVFIEGGSERAPAGLDPELVETVLQVKALTIIPPADPERVADLRERFTSAKRSAANSVQRPGFAPDYDAWASQLPPIPKSASASVAPRAKRFGFWFGGAMVVVLLAVLGLWIVIEFVDGERVNGPALGPSPTSTVPLETLFSLELPEAMRPILGGGEGDFDLYSVSAGTRSSWLGCCAGPLALYVLTGELTMKIDGDAIYLSNGAERSISVAPNTEVVLAPGDLLVTTLDTPWDSNNQGTETVYLFDWNYQSGTTLDSLAPQTWTQRDELQHFPLPTPPSGSLKISLQRLQLDLNAKFDLPEHPAFAVAWMLPFDVDATGEPLVANIAQLGEFSFMNIGREGATAYLFTVHSETAAGETIVTATP